jgi:cytochrome c oxidase cbb3-type subunit III
MSPKHGAGKSPEGDVEETHVYDGIVENNHPLPTWWKWTLYGAIVFAVVYWFDVEKLHVHPSLAETNDARVAAQARARAEEAIAMGAIDDAVLVSMSKDSTLMAQGRDIFVGTCATCHRTDGGGNIGPNLTDGYWLHGGKPANIHTCVHDGVPSKGMPTWAPQLGAQKVAAVAAYVLTMKNTNVAGGKSPQGTRED